MTPSGETSSCQRPLAWARRSNTSRRTSGVCWTLDALFNSSQDAHPRLLFKGGTSLSKSFGLIDRFSEDIDITVFRSDLGQTASVEELEALSGKKRRTRLDAIKDACSLFISGALLERLTNLLADTMAGAGISATRHRIERDLADPDRQTLLFWYPAVTSTPDSYIRSAVKIELHPIGCQDRSWREIRTRSERAHDRSAVHR